MKASLSSPGHKPSLLSPWRRRVQWATTLLLLLLPWLQFNGESLLRLDIPHLSFYLFGQTLRIEELYLVLFFTLALGLGFLLVTLALGRVWCGWLCPQTTLGDLAEWAARRCGLKVQHNSLHGPVWRKVILQLIYLFLSFLVAANLLWYFIEPRQFFVQLATFDLHYAAWITLILTTLLLYVDLALVRRLMCSEFCPYGRFQSALVDKSTLTLHLPDSELKRCIDCKSCVRTCPMEIDIRRGYQVECINCGRCLDACRMVMAKRNEPGLIRYTFGYSNDGAKGLFNPKIMLLGLTMVVLTTILTFSIIDRPVASLKVSVSHTAMPRQLADGQQGTFFNAWINNRSQIQSAYQLVARRRDTGQPLTLKGQTTAELSPGENRRLDFIVVTSAQESLTLEFVLVDTAGQQLSIAEASLKAAPKEQTHD